MVIRSQSSADIIRIYILCYVMRIHKNNTFYFSRPNYWDGLLIKKKVTVQMIDNFVHHIQTNELDLQSEDICTTDTSNPCFDYNNLQFSCGMCYIWIIMHTL